MQAKMLILLWLAMNSFISMAHGDLHQRIQLVSAEIQKYPNDLELYFKRGSLYLQHESYRKAISDFKHCIKNGHATFKHHFFLANALYQSQHFRKCVRHLLAVEDSVNTKGTASYLLSKCFEHLGDLDRASFWLQKYWDQAIFLRPDHYLAQAHLYRLKNQYELEIECLEIAISKFGYVPSLVNRQREVFQITERWTDAIKLQNAVLAVQKRKEFALFERAMLYQQMGDLTSVRVDLLQVVYEIERLPTHIQQQQSVKTLREESEAILSQIENIASE